MGKPENTLIRGITQYLHFNGISVTRMNTRVIKQGGYFMRFGDKGMSDLLAIIPPNGRAWWIEVKTGKAQLTVEQRQFLDARSAEGCVTTVARYIEDVETKLAAYKASLETTDKE